jgi:hypothetical protein
MTYHDLRVGADCSVEELADGLGASLGTVVTTVEGGTVTTAATKTATIEVTDTSTQDTARFGFR